MFDTHCHLNFKAFEGKVKEVIRRAKDAGVNCFVVPGTDVESSKKAVDLAEKFENVYAAVGIHPHHVFQVQSSKIKVQNYSSKFKNKKRVVEEGGMESSSRPRFLDEIEKLLTHPKVVAIGEVGLDRHYYQKTRYKDYEINYEFMNLQKTLFKEQIKLAIKHNKSLIIHNREASHLRQGYGGQAGELLEIIGESSTLKALAGRVVLHCCEANDQLLEFAIAHRIYIGVDGDVTYNKEKQEFVKKIPLELLVLETDSPFLLPEPLRSQKRFPNEPKNLVLIAEKIADLKKTSINQLIEATTKNAKRLFSINKDILV